VESRGHFRRATLLQRVINSSACQYGLRMTLTEKASYQNFQQKLCRTRPVSDVWTMGQVGTSEQTVVQRVPARRRRLAEEKRRIMEQKLEGGRPWRGWRGRFL
jgi:hypothetical protein